VQIVIGPGTVVDGITHKYRYLRSLEMERPKPAGIEQAIHSEKRLSGCDGCFRELPTCRQTAAEPERNEQRLPDYMKVRQTALKESHRTISTRWEPNISAESGSGDPLQAWTPAPPKGPRKYMKVRQTALKESHSTISTGWERMPAPPKGPRKYMKVRQTALKAGLETRGPLPN
jgi:hypothetical protein